MFYLYLILMLLDDDGEKYLYCKDWYEKIFNLPDQQFQELFRMKPAIFMELRNLLLTRCNENSNRFTKNLLIFLAYISHHQVLRAQKELFGVSTYKIFESVEKIVTFLFSISQDFIFLPNFNEFEELSDGFSLLGNIHGTLLAIDGTHISIFAPIDNRSDYFNRKHIYSLNCLIAVDYKMRIRYFCNGIGSAHDARLYTESTFLRDFMESLPNDKHVVGDQAFIGIQNIKVPHRIPSSTIERNFNFQLGKQRIIVENCFGLFKGKFKRFFYEQKNGESKKILKF